MISQRRLFGSLTGYILLAATFLCTLPAHAEETLPQSLARVAPGADPAVIALAVASMTCAMHMEGTQPSRLAVIDYRLPSTEPRLWVFDLPGRKLLFRELVAHGRNSGDNYAVSFSNRPESLTSSLGLYRTLGIYDGDNGYSLRMEGLEPGINSNALDRAIVIHGASYVSQKFVRKVGRIGRSHGCPAVRKQIAQPLIDSIKDGNYVFAYYPDQNWLRSSRYLHCESPAPTLAQADISPR